jgi:hypothetical protein
MLTDHIMERRQVRPNITVHQSINVSSSRLLDATAIEAVQKRELDIRTLFVDELLFKTQQK